MLKIQATGKIYGEVITLQQISKKEAAKLFADNQAIYLQSSNMMPFNCWQSVCPVKLDQDKLNADIKHNQFCVNLYTEQVIKFKAANEAWSNDLIAQYEAKVKDHNSKVITAFTQFSSICNEYSYYNCDSERGKYIHFYKVI